MAKRRDIGHEQTDQIIGQLEEKLAKVYGDAAKDIAEQARIYFEKFEARDEDMKARVGVDITESEYKQWRVNQIGRGERFEALQVKLAERMNTADEVAIEYLNEAVPSVYSLNRNYAAYTIEAAGNNIDFTLWDERQVRKLLVQDPTVMPNYPEKKAVKRGINLAYGQQQIKKNVISGLLQGLTTKQMVARLTTDIPNMGRASATRAIRTAMTSAESGARADEYADAVNQGIEMEQEWVATHDFRTRASHGAADGTHVKIGGKFHLAGGDLAYPGDPSGAPAEVYNCRCTLGPWFPELAEENNSRQKYSEWLEDKKAEYGDDYLAVEQKKAYTKSGNLSVLDKKQYAAYKERLGELAPKSEYEFKKTKYADDGEQWSELKYQYRTLGKYTTEGEVSKSKVLELDNIAYTTKKDAFSNNRNFSRQGNVGVAEVDGNILFSHSRINSSDQQAAKNYSGEYPLVYKGVSRYNTAEPSIGSNDIPSNHTEVKLFEEIARNKRTTDTFTVNLLTQKCMCDSCRSVMRQFKDDFPNATVNLINGVGTKSWLYRKGVGKESIDKTKG